MAINASVTTGQRRAAIFSCLMGINIAPRLSCRQNFGQAKTLYTSRQCSYAIGPFPDDASPCPLSAGHPFDFAQGGSSGSREGLPWSLSKRRPAVAQPEISMAV